MKQRHGFVSNSSSSSFVLKTRTLTEFQLKAVMQYEEYAEKFMRLDKINDYIEGWTIEHDKSNGVIKGDTFMDNFEMDAYLVKLGIAASEFKFEKWG
jgi:predicted transcriptional regulator